ncbi:hypothetical protein KC726_00485 [Candidatus Woesebacteria bacterium]|nr:hypothetical protein [Candidatus Woesebacteria bacterium]
MKLNSYQKYGIVIVLVLILINVAVFIKSMKMSDEISYYETKITELKESNVSMKEQLYEMQSITHTASIAAELGYAAYDDPIYIEQPQYARR